MIEMYKLERYPNYYLDLITMSLDTLRQKYLRATDVNDIILWIFISGEEMFWSRLQRSFEIFSLYFERIKRSV